MKDNPNALDISRRACPDATLLGRRVDADKDKVGLLNRLVDVCGKKEVASACFSDDISKAWLVNRELKIGAVPGIDARLVEINDGYLDVGTLDGDDSARRSTCGRDE
jgi:hypothetical protein